MVKRMQKTIDTCFLPFNILFGRFIFSIPPLKIMPLALLKLLMKITTGLIILK